MNIKDTIKALLQSKFGGVQLSDARVEQFAKSLEGKVTTEEELLQKMEAFNEIQSFASMRADDDRARSAQAELEKLKKPAPAPQPAPAPAPTEEEEMPAWAKAWVEGQKAITDKLSALEGDKVVANRKTALLSKLPNADADYSAKVLRDFGRMSFATDEDFTTYLADVEADFATHTQTVAESKLGKDVPYLGIGGADLKDTDVSPAMKEMVQQREEAAKAKLNA